LLSISPVIHELRRADEPDEPDEPVSEPDAAADEEANGEPRNV